MILPYKKLWFRADIPLPETELLRIWKGHPQRAPRPQKGGACASRADCPGATLRISTGNSSNLKNRQQTRPFLEGLRPLCIF